MSIKIPRAAMPAIRVLRRDVRKPSKRRLRNKLGCTRFIRGKQGDVVCLMGLHPKSLSCLPVWWWTFADGECSDKAVKATYRWWDNLTPAEAREAIDLIWGDEA